MSREVIIKSADTGAKLEFLDVKGEHFTVVFSSVTLSASQRVWGYTDCRQLANLFREMAQSWKGWEGVKTWGSIEGEFNLACTSDKLGHVTLEVDLVERDTSEPWSTKFNIQIETWQLEKIANEMITLFGKC
jgi:hypothetical protein